MKFMLITRDPEIAVYAEECGVERVFVDMESLGKADRQGHLDTHMASHSVDDVRTIRQVLTTAELLVRVNPLGTHTPQEVDRVLDAGADRVMLPMFSSAEDVETFLECVDDRVPVVFLAETPLAVTRIRDWVPLLGPDDQVHFGLNDLSLAMGMPFLFEPLATRYLDYSTRVLRAAGVEFGIGGVARIGGGGALPAEWIVGEHIRLGSQWAILSRAFHGRANDLRELTAAIDLAREVGALREIAADFERDAEKARALRELAADLDLSSRERFEENQLRLAARVFEIVHDRESERKARNA